ncbi:MAG: glycosyltransferase family 4 protein [Ignavibacteriales bacterium]
MRILLVAMAESIHTARWVEMISDQGWDIHLFPSTDNSYIHPNLKNVTVHTVFYKYYKDRHSSVRIKGIPVFLKTAVFIGNHIIKWFSPKYQAVKLTKLIKKINPDIIHSMEIQAAGYLTLEAKKKLLDCFPPWIVTNWGSDIYFFGRFPEHQEKITEVMNYCNVYSCECQRDVELAKRFGFEGEILPVYPNTGGFDLELISQLRQPGAISDRRIIMLKGYQNWAGRALNGLRGLERCADLLSGYEIIIYSANNDVEIAAELFTKSTGIPTKIIPKYTPHTEILKLHGQARISIGISISDGISTSLLEAIAMGSFPIQSNTSGADEWIVDGETGILVPPEDPEIIEQAIRKALTDDELVNSAAQKNYELTKTRLDKSLLKLKAIEMYNKVVNDKGENNVEC